MFGNRQSAGPSASQTARSRRPNGRAGSPGPSKPAGGSIFAGATGKAPAGSYSQRQPQQHQRSQYQQQDGEYFQPSSDITDEQRHEIMEAFTLFDLNKDGKLDYHELRVAMKALGFDMPKEEIIAILHEHGVLASGQQPPAVPPTPVHRLQITEQAFIDIMTQKIIARDPMEEISRAFELFAGGSSRQGGGEMKISINELRRVAEELGESVEEEELRAMIDEFDIDNDGMISRDEFIAICRAGV